MILKNVNFGSKGAFIYYVITLGGVGGPDTNDDIDDALRGDVGVTIKMMM